MANEKQRERVRKNAVQLEKAASNGNSGVRHDGYKNLLNKYGIEGRDNSTAYFYDFDPQEMDTTMTAQYTTNGIFASIIDIPAQEATKRGFDLHINDDEAEDYAKRSLQALHWQDVFCDGIKMSRLYAGAIGVMIINDGRGLDEPLDEKAMNGIEQIYVFDRGIAIPDYSSMYSNYGAYGMKRTTKIGQPEYFDIFSVYGSARVHASRCLIFKNGKMPERTMSQIYRYWGIPEYARVRREMQEMITTHGNASRMLERSVQPVYKMEGLADLLATDMGEDAVLERLRLIDTARGFMNSVVIDGNGEDYSFQSAPMTGIRDVIEATCSQLSAVTHIPQTILFGRSPSGMNATGESDLENYYNYIDQIRNQQMRDNFARLLHIIFQIGVNNGDVEAMPMYDDFEFEALKQTSEMEKAQIEQAQAQAEQAKIQAISAYVELGALDPTEVRSALQEGKEMKPSEIVTDDDIEAEEPMSEEEAYGKETQKKSENVEEMSTKGLTNADGLDIIDLQGDRKRNRAHEAKKAAAQSGDWDESKVNRAENGQFAEKGGGASGGGSESKEKPQEQKKPEVKKEEQPKAESKPQDTDKEKAEAERKANKHKALAEQKKAEAEAVKNGEDRTAVNAKANVTGTGANVSCIGFRKTPDGKNGHYNDHVETGEPVYIKENGEKMTPEEYEAHVVEMLKKPVGGEIEGFAIKRRDKQGKWHDTIVRFNKATGEFCKGTPMEMCLSGFVAKYFLDKEKTKVNPNYIKDAKKYFDDERRAAITSGLLIG